MLLFPILCSLSPNTCSQITVPYSLLMKVLTNKELEDIVKFQSFGGQRIEEWLVNIAAADQARIYSAIVQGMESESLSIPNIMKNVFADNGAVAATRKQVKQAARTLSVAVANQSKLETFKKIMKDGSGDVTAVEWSAFFDHRTCPVCASMNGKRWNADEIDQAKVPPIHPNCRCTLLPYNDETEDFDENGIGLAENFDELAKEEYEADTGKTWNALAESTKKNKTYQYRKNWEKETGKSAYIDLESSNFDDYLKGRSEEFQREWLGATRYNLWKEGRLKVDQMVDPDRGFKRTIKDLEKYIGFKVAPAEMTTKEFFDFSDQNAENYTKEEQESSQWYSERENATTLNTALRNGEDKLSEELKQNIAQLESALSKYALPEDTILFRGARDAHLLFGGQLPHVGQTQKWKGFVSTTIGDYVAERYSKFAGDSVIIELHAPAGTNGIPMGTKKLSKVHQQDKEFLLKHETEIKVLSVEKKTNGYYVIAEITR